MSYLGTAAKDSLVQKPSRTTSASSHCRTSCALAPNFTSAAVSQLSCTPGMLKVVLVDRLLEEETEAARVVWAVAMVAAVVVAVVMGVMVDRELPVTRALEALEPATDTTSARLDSFFFLAGRSVFTVFIDCTDVTS